MANIIETSEWTTAIYLLETSDWIHGGQWNSGTGDGISNRQATELANRTKYLYDKLVVEHNSDGTHPLALVRAAIAGLLTDLYVSPNAAISPSKLALSFIGMPRPFGRGLYTAVSELAADLRTAAATSLISAQDISDATTTVITAHNANASAHPGMQTLISNIESANIAAMKELVVDRVMAELGAASYSDGFYYDCQSSTDVVAGASSFYRFDQLGKYFAPATSRDASPSYALPTSATYGFSNPVVFEQEDVRGNVTQFVVDTANSSGHFNYSVGAKVIPGCAIKIGSAHYPITALYGNGTGANDVVFSGSLAAGTYAVVGIYGTKIADDKLTLQNDGVIPTGARYVVTTNLDSSAWQSIHSVSATQTSNGQEVRYALSFDAGNTYNIWTGSVWQPVVRLEDSTTWQYMAYGRWQNAEETISGTDIAPSATVSYVGSISSGTAGNLVDGNNSTVFALTPSASNMFTFTFATAQNIGSITVENYNGVGTTAGRLMYSDDGSTWVDTNQTGISVASGASAVLPVTNFGSHRYWGIRTNGTDLQLSGVGLHARIAQAGSKAEAFDLAMAQPENHMAATAILGSTVLSQSLGTPIGSANMTQLSSAFDGIVNAQSVSARNSGTQTMVPATTGNVIAMSMTRSAAAFDGLVGLRASSSVSSAPGSVSLNGWGNAVGKDWGATKKKAITKVVVKAPSDTGFLGAGTPLATQLRLIGSDDGVTWSTIWSTTVSSPSVAQVVDSGTITNDNPYRYHAVDVYGDAATTASIGEVEFYTTAASAMGYGNSVGVDYGAGNSKAINRVVVKSPSDAGFLGMSPQATTLRVRGSQDNITWDTIHTSPLFTKGGTATTAQVYDSGVFPNATPYRYVLVDVMGNGWNCSNISDLILYEGSVTVPGLDLVNYKAFSSIGGFNYVTNNDVGFAVTLKTTNGTQTPEVSGVTFGYTPGKSACVLTFDAPSELSLAQNPVTAWCFTAVVPQAALTLPGDVTIEASKDDGATWFEVAGYSTIQYTSGGYVLCGTAALPAADTRNVRLRVTLATGVEADVTAAGMFVNV